jgi:anti-sigma B factor antagonist
MKIELRNTGTMPVLAPTGRITIGRPSADLKAALDSAIDSGAHHIIIDGSNVEYLDSTGIGELIAAARKLSETNAGRVGIARPSTKLREILEITGLNALFIVRESETEVAAALPSAAPVRF